VFTSHLQKPLFLEKVDADVAEESGEWRQPCFVWKVPRLFPRAFLGSLAGFTITKARNEYNLGLDITGFGLLAYIEFRINKLPASYQGIKIAGMKLYLQTTVSNPPAPLCIGIWYQ
jgi:hypothetical protein